MDDSESLVFVSDSSVPPSDNESTQVPRLDSDGIPLPEPPRRGHRRKSGSRSNDAGDDHSHADEHVRVPRRRSSSGSFAKIVDIISDRKPPVEFVRPIEGTPAAEALAANKLIKVSKVTKGLHKIRGMKRPKMKNFNLVKKLNKTTKRKKKHFSKNFKGKVIDGVHELYTLTAGIMLGIRCTVGNAAYTATTVSVPDFTSVSNIAFPPAGNPDAPIPTPAHDLAHTFKFKSYSPKIFHRLREFFDISAAAYMDSVCGDYNFIEFISNSKSGQFFFYSHDGQYMLKTQTKEENKFMIRILPHYYQYLTENPHSLLVRILGMHRIKMYHLRRKVHFVVMTSVFDTPAQINTIYDLKGSLVGRAATQKERDSGGVLKDQDLLSDQRKLHLGAKKEAFMKQLEKDAMFLAKLNIMDYSLLVGIHDRSLRGRETLVAPARDSSTSQPGPPPLLPAASAPAALFGGSVTSTGSDSGQIVAPIPPAYLHSHSNTPFRLASLNTDLNNPFSAHSGDVATNLFPAGVMGSPSGGRRKRAATATRSGDAEQDGHSHIRANVGRSASLGEDPVVRTLYPALASASIDNGQIAHTMEQIEADGDEDGEEEDGDGDGDDEEDGETDESEFEDVDAGDSDEESDRAMLPVAPIEPTAATAPPTGAELVVEDGAGALGPEGFRLSEILRVQAVVADKEKEKEKIAATSAKSTANGRTQSASEASAPIYTYGPGQARRHPWTTRKDEGINSRLPDGKRGDEIYYLGIIDILQQYNTNKRMETIIKGVTSDASQISSVSPKKYARRFVSFMDANID